MTPGLDLLPNKAKERKTCLLDARQVPDSISWCLHFPPLAEVLNF